MSGLVLTVMLGTYACALGVLGGRALAGARWTSRAPGLAIALWQAIGLSLVLAAALAGLSLALPAELLADGVTDFLNACVHTLRDQYSTVAGALTASTGFLVTVAVLGRAVWGVGSELARARGSRRRQLSDLRIVGRRDETLGVYLLDDDRTLAYCLPGRDRAVMITTAALAALSPTELEAVLHHEAAHLRWRHDLVLSTATGLRRAFPFVPALHSAEHACQALIEMVADDAAARRTSHTTVASSLVRMASTDAPRFALGVNGNGSASRAYRMLQVPARLGAVRRTGTWCVAAALVVAPLVVTFTPAIAAAASRHCTFL